MPFKKGQSGNPGGRPVGAMKESRKMLSMVINGRLPMSRRVDLLAKLAEGISMERVILSKDGKQKRIEVFQVRPDIDALKYLTDQADGKAPGGRCRAEVRRPGAAGAGSGSHRSRQVQPRRRD